MKLLPPRLILIPILIPIPIPISIPISIRILNPSASQQSPPLLLFPSNMPTMPTSSKRRKSLNSLHTVLVSIMKSLLLLTPNLPTVRSTIYLKQNSTPSKNTSIECSLKVGYVHPNPHSARQSFLSKNPMVVFALSSIIESSMR